VTGSARLGTAYWPEVQASTLLVPLGSVEQHGPHLPLDTDTRIAVAVATRAATAAGADTMVAPALAYGASGEHEGFPGTISIGSTALSTVLIELVRSATRTFPRLVLVSGHGGNLDGVRTALQALHAESRTVVACFPAVPGGDAHAGRTETSLLLAIAPDVVRGPPWIIGATEPLAGLMPRLRSEGVAGVSPNGVLGNPAGASAAEGERLLDRLVEHLLPLAYAARHRAS
jgi:mycofactocin precursor peptide peptidase